MPRFRRQFPAIGPSEIDSTSCQEISRLPIENKKKAASSQHAARRVENCLRQAMDEEVSVSVMMLLNPKPQTRNPKPKTLNPKPETRNPKP